MSFFEVFYGEVVIGDFLKLPHHNDSKSLEIYDQYNQRIEPHLYPLC